MTTLTNDKYLQDVNSLMDDMIRADRYGAINASLANSYAFSIVAGCQNVLERQDQLDAIAKKNRPYPTVQGDEIVEIPSGNKQYHQIADWLADLERRLDRDSELFVWFKDTAINEGMAEFLNTDPEEIVSRLCTPRKTPTQELEQNAQLLGVSLTEAKKLVSVAAREKATQSELWAPQTTKMAKQYLTRAESNISELNAFEARRIASTIERKAIQYAERLAVSVLSSRPASNLLGLQSDWTKEAIGSIKILKQVVEDAGKLVKRAQQDIDAGTKREGETTYDTDHGTKAEIA